MDSINNERVLGYIKSTKSTENDLLNVSGGSRSNLTHSGNIKFSGNISCPDVRYDQVIDW